MSDGNILGIVGEYNPFHNGHAYHLEESVKRTSATGVVCAMSGDFVQRGEAAILNKWKRAGIAVRCGADLVVEIPVFCCLANAGIYGRGAVKLLESLGFVTHLSFGSESGDIAELEEIADRLDRYDEEISRRISVLSRQGLSWPAARDRAYRDFFPDGSNISSSSNDILGIEYLRALHGLTPLTIKRKGAGYNDSVDKDPGAVFHSASGIRQALCDGRDISSMVPEECFRELSGLTSDALEIRAERYFQLVRYRILTSDEDEMARLPDGGEGIGNRLRKAVISASDIQDLIMKAKTRRYTYTHISRLLAQLVTGMDRGMTDPACIRVLAMNERGREMLHEASRKELFKMPLVTNVNKTLGRLNADDTKDQKIFEQLSAEIRAGDIYNLITGADLYRCSDRVSGPVII
ncbi:tRNA(Met) cytidine acetate ligase [Mobilibacterium timonense]|uniref:tRNA(Met) cytidine acetate ligase n=1 Tax=Mobilibacterium timonense TaxID=1871012 RepID=UPI000985388B|nr:nucleotidyltransferase family protein [Mobilibacterium timonense]